jgi:hypothetical protein
MTPQRALVPSVEPLTEVGPLLVPEPAAAAVNGNVLQFPSAAVPLIVAPTAAAQPVTRAFLIAEFVTAFVAIPLVLTLNVATALPRLPMLWIAAAYGIFQLWRDPTFDRRQLWNAGPLRSQLPQMLALFAAGVVVVSALVSVYAPALFLSLPRLHPRFWALVLITYPIFSVYPQSLVYRTFLLHRYRSLFQREADAPPAILIFASAAAFALMHLPFHNWIAVALTFPGGILFARHYLNSKSLCVSSIEHALYGCFLFTIGLGQYFYLRIG